MERPTPILRFPSIPPVGSASTYAFAEAAKRTVDRAAYRSDKSGTAIIWSDRTGQRTLRSVR